MFDKTEFYVGGVMSDVPECVRHLGTAAKCEQCGQDVLYHLPAFKIAQAVSKERQTQLKLICQTCFTTQRPEKALEVMLVTESSIETSKQISKLMAERQ